MPCATPIARVRPLPRTAFRLEGWACVRGPPGGSSLALVGRTLATVPIVPLPASDAVPPSAQLGDVDTMLVRATYAAGWPDGLVESPRAPAVEQPAAGGCLDGSFELARCCRVSQADCVSGVLPKIPGVHAAWPLVWTLNIGGRDRERSRSVPHVRHHHEFRARGHTMRVDQ